MRGRWLNRRALLLHVSLVVWFPGCLFAFWWQVHRAFDGNGLSYLYSVEWPAFALAGVWAWWQLIHTDPGTVGKAAQERMALADAQAAAGARTTAADAGKRPLTGAPRVRDGTVVHTRRRDEEDEELAAYNDRLAELAARGPQTWRRR